MFELFRWFFGLKRARRAADRIAPEQAFAELEQVSKPIAPAEIVVELPQYTLVYGQATTTMVRGETNSSVQPAPRAWADQPMKEPNISDHLERLPFAVEIVSGADALSTVFRLHEEHPDQYAFIMGDEFSVDRIADQFDEDVLNFSRKPEEILRLAFAMTPESLLNTLRARLAQRFKENEPEAATSVTMKEVDGGFAIESRVNARFGMSDVKFAKNMPRGPWPEEPQPNCNFSSHLDLLTRKFDRETAIGRINVPVSEFWKVFAELRFGGFNECPPPEIHVALAKHWAEHYGAKLISVSHDTVEFSVSQPVTDKQAALELAELHYAYCPDIVDQGVGTIEELAATLMGSTVWYFWWD